MINNTTKTIFRSIRALPCSALVALFSLHCVAAENVSIVGKVYFEANVQSNWNSDMWYDHTDILGEENRDKVVVSSGSVQANPEANGNFTLKGKSTNGNFLIEVKAEGFQTAYAYVNHEDVKGDEYKQTVDAKDMIMIRPEAPEAGRNIIYYRMGSCPVYGAGTPCPTASAARTDNLSLEAGIVTMLLLREEKTDEENQFDVFKYTPPKSD